MPGCSGGEQDSSALDYCIVDPSGNVPAPVTTAPTSATVTQAPVTPVPVTPAPVTPMPTQAPSTPRPTTAAPVPLPQVQDVGDNGDPAQAFPLGNCQADCDSDDDVSTT